jgi:hypothetical protein
MMLLATAMSYLNEYGLMHTDLHGANIALMNDKLVAHDWGRSFDSRNEKVLKDYLDWAKRTSALKNRAEYRYIIPILDNTGYFQGLVNRTTKAGRNKLQMVITRSWDTLALIGTSEYESLITKDAVNKFLAAFVRIVAHRDAEFSSNLRKIIPLAFVSTAVIPPAAIYAPTPSIKVKKTRKVNSKPKKTRKAVPPAVVPPAVVPVKVRKTRKVNSKPKRTRKVKVVVPPAPIPKSMYVSDSAPTQEVTKLRQDIAACDDEVDKLRNKVRQIAELTKLSPRP